MPSQLLGKRNKGKFYFCSRDCHEKGFDTGGKIELKCKNCGKLYKTYRSHVKWRGSTSCSNDCRLTLQREAMRKLGLKNKGKKGEKIGTWKGGSSYKKALWILFSKYIRQRDEGICISCGKVDDWKNTDAGHYIPKTAGLALYFNEKNVNAQCTYCNRWMHGNLSKYAIALRKKYGEDILEELDSQRRKITKISIPQYQELIRKYQEFIKNLRATGV